MGIEDDLKHAFKYANFSGNVDPLKMMRKMLNQMELRMLKQMQMQINARVGVLTMEDSEMNPFTILGVDLNSTKEEVSRAYTTKAQKAHPDKGGTHDDMVKVNAARDAIYMFKGWSRL